MDTKQVFRGTFHSVCSGRLCQNIFHQKTRMARSGRRRMKLALFPIHGFAVPKFKRHRKQITGWQVLSQFLVDISLLQGIEASMNKCLKFILYPPVDRDKRSKKLSSFLSTRISQTFQKTKSIFQRTVKHYCEYCNNKRAHWDVNNWQ